MCGLLVNMSYAWAKGILVDLPKRSSAVIGLVTELFLLSTG